MQNNNTREVEGKLLKKTVSEVSEEFAIKFRTLSMQLSNNRLQCAYKIICEA